MKRVMFICEGCKKAIRVQENIFKQVYEGQKDCLSCRGKNKRKAPLPEGKHSF